MRTTDQTLLEQLKISRRELLRRKEYLAIKSEDCANLIAHKELIAANIDEFVEEFYQALLPLDEIERLIGDAETLKRLKNHQRNYILSMYDGQYDEEHELSRS